MVSNFEASPAVIGSVVVTVVRAVVAAHLRLLRVGAGSVGEPCHLLLGDSSYNCRLGELEGDDGLGRDDHAAAGRRGRTSYADAGARSCANGRACTTSGDSADDGAKGAKADRAVDGARCLVTALLLPELGAQRIGDASQSYAVDLERECALTAQRAGFPGVNNGALHEGAARDGNHSAGRDVVEDRAVKGRARLNVVGVQAAVDSDGKDGSGRDRDLETGGLSSRRSVGLVRSVAVERTALRWTIGLRLALIRLLRLAVGLWLSGVSL